MPMTIDRVTVRQTLARPSRAVMSAVRLSDTSTAMTVAMARRSGGVTSTIAIGSAPPRMNAAAPPMA